MTSPWRYNFTWNYMLRSNYVLSFNPNSLDNKGSCWILRNCYCSVTMLRELGLIFCELCNSVVAERSTALDSSSGVARMWVRIPAWLVAAFVSLSKTLIHNCFALRMGRKAVGPVCCIMHVKKPRILIVKKKGLAPVFLDSRLEHPAGWICVRYKSYHYYY